MLALESTCVRSHARRGHEGDVCPGEHVCACACSHIHVCLQVAVNYISGGKVSTILIHMLSTETSSLLKVHSREISRIQH